MGEGGQWSYFPKIYKGALAWGQHRSCYRQHILTLRVEVLNKSLYQNCIIQSLLVQGQKK